jgi:hypothetical protein
MGENRQKKFYFLWPVYYPKTGFALKLNAIVLSNHPNSVNDAGNKAQKRENQVYPKISADAYSQKYAQRGKKNCSDYAD